MTRFYFLLIALFATCGLMFAQVEKSVNTPGAGQLGTLFTQTDYDNVTKLTIGGQLNAYDFVFIRKFTVLKELNLKDVQIVEFPDQINNQDIYYFYAANQLPHGGLKNMKIKKIVFPTSINSIGKMALSNTHILGNIAIPEGIINIEETAFSQCDSITSVTFPSTLSKIGLGAFADCDNLSGTIVFPNGLKSIKAEAFYGCNKLSGSLAFPNGLEEIGTNAFKLCTSIDGNIIIPASVKKSGSSAFAETKISSAEINMDTIPYEMFSSCYSLTNVTLNNTKVIDSYAFTNCSTLTHINFPVSLREIGGSAFANTNLTGNITFPENLQKIGDDAFSGLNNITGVNFNSSLKTIGFRSFFQCTGIEQQLILPNSITAIGSQAFDGCYKLTKIVVPENITNIEFATFARCSAVKSIFLPSSITQIQDEAFNSCTSVDSIYSNNPVPPVIQANTFSSSMYEKSIVAVLPTSINSYKADQYWGLFGNKVVSNVIIIEPKLLSAYPGNNTDVTVNPSLTLKFNKKMVLTDNFMVQVIEKSTGIATYMYGTGNRVKTDSTIVYMEPQKTALKSNTTYKLQISANSFEDLSGNIFPQATMNFEFTTNSGNMTELLSFNQTDLSLTSTTFGGVTKESNPLCTGNQALMHRFYSKHNLTEKEIPVILYKRLDDCLVNTPSNYTPSAYFTWDATSLVLIDGAGFQPDVYYRALIDFTGFPTNAPITNIVTRVSCKQTEGVNTTLNLTAYSNGNILRSMPVYTTEDAGYFDYEQNNAGNKYYYREIHFPVLNGEKIDSIVIDKNKLTMAKIMQVKIEYKALSKPIVNLGPDRNVCTFSDEQLDAGYFPGANYLWNTGETTQKIAINGTSDYSVIVKNQMGTSKDTIHISAYPRPLKAFVDSAITKCAGEQVTLSATYNPDFTYKWNTGATTRSISVTDEGLYTVEVSNGVCTIIDSVGVVNNINNVGFRLSQCCLAGYDDIQGELYKKNENGRFELLDDKIMYGDMAVFSGIPAGEYIFKAHFLKYSNGAVNPWLDTYHNGSTTWAAATILQVNCQSDTLISFNLASQPTGFVFNGTGVISGKIDIIEKTNPQESKKKLKSVTDDCETKILLFDGNGQLIATKCPDSEGNYSFTNLPAGNYSIGVERTGFEVEELFAATVTEGTTISNANFTVNENTQMIEQGLGTYIKNISATSFSFDIYPNPVKENAIISIELPSDSETLMTIVDITGKIVFTQISQLYKGKNTIAFNAKKLKGLYLIKISTADGMSTKRLLVE